MSDIKDPYFSSKSSFDSNFLNFSPYASSTNSEVFCFNGNAYSFKTQVSELNKEDISKLKSLRINITGTQVKNMDTCCLYSTIISGSILVFPLFFFCCDWWKRKVNVLYNV